MTSVGADRLFKVAGPSNESASVNVLHAVAHIVSFLIASRRVLCSELVGDVTGHARASVSVRLQT
jgi:hypothetical protein